MLDLSPIMESLATVAGVPGVYTPAGGESVEVVCWAGKNPQQVDRMRGSQIGSRSQDWMLPVSSYAADPQVGDRLLVIYQGQEVLWELRTRGSDPVWVWSDRQRLLRRLHFVEVQVSDV